MRRFLKKFTEGNARDSRLINCADVTKIRETRVVRGRMSKIRARAITPACAQSYFEKYESDCFEAVY